MTADQILDEEYRSRGGPVARGRILLVDDEQAIRSALGRALTAEGRETTGQGTAKATESKSRFLRPLVAGLIAAKSMDNDTGKVGSSSAGAKYRSPRTVL